MSYQVRFTRDAEHHLLELYQFLAEKDFAAAERALVKLRKAFELLESFPFSCRKAEGTSATPFVREMVVSFGDSGYVVLFEIEPSAVVTVSAVRHQREDDFH
jgi:plasmid stabilization system protein ParE